MESNKTKLYKKLYKKRFGVDYMTKEKSKMNYSGWSKVIEDLEVITKTAQELIETNNVFLEAACEERKKYPKPEEPKNTT